jgi:ketosteroid isomerase-like protein
MMRTVALAGLLLAAGCGSQEAGQGSNQAATEAARKGPQRPSREETERYIRRSAAEWADVVVTGDVAPLRRFIADDYVGVSSRGEVRDKAKILEPFKAGDFTASSLDYVNIRHFGDTVIAQGAETVKRRGGGPDLRLIWTDVWLWRDGQWQIVASQDSVRPPAR